MYGPLLISLLPPEQPWDSAVSPVASLPTIPLLLLAGLLLAICLRYPER